MSAAKPKVDGRRQRSLLTRGRVIEAASQLLVERGYVATTIEDVADHADVAVQTVYYVFGTKPNLLAAVLDASIAGDGDPVPVLERAWVHKMQDAQDLDAAVKRLVEGSVAILVRAAPVYEVVRRASADPEVSALLDQTRTRRRADQRALIEMLLASARSQATLDAKSAADIFYGLMSEEVFQLLVIDCRWSVARFQKWAI